ILSPALVGGLQFTNRGPLPTTDCAGMPVVLTRPKSLRNSAKHGREWNRLGGRTIRGHGRHWRKRSDLGFWPESACPKSRSARQLDKITVNGLPGEGSMATVDERTRSAPETRTAAGRTGMEIPRVFSREGVSPFDEVEWELRTAEI